MKRNGSWYWDDYGDEYYCRVADGDKRGMLKIASCGSYQDHWNLSESFIDAWLSKYKRIKEEYLPFDPADIFLQEKAEIPKEESKPINKLVCGHSPKTLKRYTQGKEKTIVYVCTVRGCTRGYRKEDLDEGQWEEAEAAQEA